jgi:hypothetical protein
MKFQFVSLNYERTALKTAGATWRKELCADSIAIIIGVIYILAGESAALPERNFKGKEKRAAQPATILPDG